MNTWTLPLISWKFRSCRTRVSPVLIFPLELAALPRGPQHLTVLVVDHRHELGGGHVLDDRDAFGERESSAPYLAETSFRVPTNFSRMFAFFGPSSAKATASKKGRKSTRTVDRDVSWDLVVEFAFRVSESSRDRGIYRPGNG